MRMIKDQWKFKPQAIIIHANESVELRIYNEDSYSHGFFIEELGINQFLAPQEETIIHIKAEKPGTYGFFCSVLCGEAHYRMSGQLIVKE
jgi:cytochrome c oxidase subunit 2